MKHAIITAGSKGLGRKVTEHFLKNNCSVTVNYLSDVKRVEALKEEWKTYNDKLQFVQGDVTKKEDIVKIVKQAKEKFGRIDYLINNAGPYVFEEKKLVDYEDDEWYKMLEGNLSSVFHFSKLVIPIMREQQFGRIITYGFQDAEHCPAWLHRSAFGAAKVGLVSLTRSIATEEAKNGITANMVSPGDITGKMKEADIDTARTIEDTTTPVGRPGSGEDLARLIGFLCEEDSDMITGSVVSAAGGVHVANQNKRKTLSYN
ncbi:SDR family oxidoreductase [Virgibacillus alimentarius]|uniref:3-oxoacyl-[acyl-carrier protein] reductase n=1 Tax=Virgibacillus alimentarius TaxID=698769 RepID=A0ABS4S9E7_9BACI|nr:MULTISPECIES: SDR family oxidoreductase [Virgibacillus]MBP2258120.1 3-oxoacyl-[acyl-carrier protein] reductase [Virgibacillus alimentarius]HLR69135.1 SDR family oxidoreductase [Virgibacillus sp.]